ncbi:MAG: phosphotransferase [Clostridia bacterium]|nr:phosphotransferase [Clostridia bacterium]
MITASKLIPYLHKKYPELRNLPYKVLDSSWSYLVVIAGDKYVFRFPRREEVKKRLEKERKILPLLKGILPISIPDFIYTSDPSDDLVYVGYPMIKGEPLHAEKFRTLSSLEKGHLAQMLGKFLTVMHRFSHLDLLEKKNDTSQIKAEWERLYKLCSKAFPFMETQTRDWCKNLFERFLLNPENFRFKPQLIHGDLHGAHILYNTEDKKLSGIIDFEDMQVGDPAFDFMHLYITYGKEFVQSVIKYYQGTVDSTFNERIESFYGKTLNIWGILHSVETNNKEILNIYLKRLQSEIKNQ